jgi:Arc/MetJ-type ribon-helix-helix transcriptional regulator
MTVDLSPKTQKLLEERLKEGPFESADELVYAALEALDCATLDEETLDALDRAEEQIERGEYHEWDAVKEQLKARNRKK